MRQNSILIMLHCEQDTGYAIGPLEKAFESAALLAGYQPSQILWSYSKVIAPSKNIFELGYHTNEDADKLDRIHKLHKIETILAFDMPYPTSVGRQAHRLGIKNIVSYWGASMSSINSGFKWLAKKTEWALRRASAPTRFIFESEAMRLTATQGRGVPKSRTVVIPLGVNLEQFKPVKDSNYAHRKLGIPENRKIIFYSGHMEERKGIRVLIEAINLLYRLNKLEEFHLLICGNKDNESTPYEALISNSSVGEHITFAGYRDDIPQLMQASFIGTIASTGWDSFTMSSVEMLASGLPLIVSNLQGLKETILPGYCGELIEPGSSEALAKYALEYLNSPEKYNAHRRSARLRAEENFSLKKQIENISQHLIPHHLEKKTKKLMKKGHP
ncbi:glycosyltransferase family 4 protein [Saccharospirillum alexandrii]|uniref:glycosyltransferase family 4 protein n=1 Tax=Saccharospirillum alexandrii TaxID=2448477 RepID=UPI000FD8FDC2|nr:glycosyltransferase family 4 protein [Saccharospirillum alexandrii]